jgi:hypothetical protein
MTPLTRPDDIRQARAGLHFALGSVARPNPVVAAWRWRYELAAAAALVAVWLVLGTAAVAALTGGVAAVVLVTAASGPRGRRYLMARAWVIVTPHRVRAGCAQAWIHSRNGKIPAVLLTVRRPFGERVYLWCRAGTSADHLSSARELLASACWADDVRVFRSPRHAHIVTLDVIRCEQPDSAAGPGQADRADAATPTLSVPSLNGSAGNGSADQIDDDGVPPRQIST